MNRRKFLHLSGIAGGMFLTPAGFAQQLFDSGNDLLALPSQVSVQTDTSIFNLEPQKGKTQWQGKDVLFELTKSNNSQSAYLTSGKTGIRKIIVSWKMKFPDTKYLNDQWERTYGDAGWQSIGDFPVKPWYFLFTDGELTNGIGVKTGASSFCSWKVTPAGLQLTIDVRNGGSGVILNGRKLKAAELVARKGSPGESSFDATRSFCNIMCEKPRLPAQPVYGINDWYFAYGNNSAEDIIRNCIYFSDLVSSTSNLPYCVIDDGWSQTEKNTNSNSEVTHSQLASDSARFPDMAKLAERISLEGFHPGIWVRPLWSTAGDADSLTLPFKGVVSGKKPQRILDPSIPESIERITSYFTTAYNWGYRMIKHDYTSYDLFGMWGFDMLKNDFTSEGWHFNDQSKTSAEIVLHLYQSIRAAGKDALLIGCNTFSHLSAGIFELQRTGDDTSGKDWARTKKMGINTLAFRLPQHNQFYCLDADCVGLTTEVPWALNKQWMDLLSRSGTALFISASTDALVPDVRKSVREAFARAAQVQTSAEPLNWMTSFTPDKWKLDGQEFTYNWL